MQPAGSITSSGMYAVGRCPGDPFSLVASQVLWVRALLLDTKAPPVREPARAPGFRLNLFGTDPIKMESSGSWDKN